MDQTLVLKAIPAALHCIVCWLIIFAQKYCFKGLTRSEERAEYTCRWVYYLGNCLSVRGTEIAKAILGIISELSPLAEVIRYKTLKGGISSNPCFFMSVLKLKS